MNDERGTMNARNRSSFIVHRSSFFPALAFLLVATSALALDVPPSPTQWFTDKAGVVDSAAASALNEKLRSFETQSGVQFIIYIFPSLEGEAMEDFTIRCATAWKAGNKKYDNGLILFAFMQERKLRIEVGYGLEGTVTDAVSSRVIREDVAPHFKTGDYAGGLNAGADDLIARISGHEAPVEPSSPGARPQSSSRTSSGGGFPSGLLLLIIIFAIFVLPRLFMSRRGATSSGCGGCFWPMFFLGGGGRGITFGSGGGGGWGGGGGFGGGGFSGGGGSFGGGGASGGW